MEVCLLLSARLLETDQKKALLTNRDALLVEAMQALLALDEHRPNLAERYTVVP